MIPKDFNVRKLAPMYCRDGNIRKTAEALDISETAVANYQLGKRAPNARIIRKVCALNGIRADDLLQLPERCRKVPKVSPDTMAGRIRYAQMLNEFDVESAAAAADIHRQTLAKWEQGALPGFWKLRQYCIAMNVSADWIIGKEET